MSITPTRRDLLFAFINGLLIGALAPFLIQNLGAVLPMPYWMFVALLSLLSVAGIIIGAYLTRIAPFFFQLAKFGLIGVSNTIIDLGIYTLLIFLTGITSGAAITGFKTISVIIAIINSYLWNKFWSFENKEVKQVAGEFTKFVSVSIIGLIFNVAITTLMTNYLNHPNAISNATWAGLSGITASVLVLTWNFVGYKLLVFKK